VPGVLDFPLRGASLSGVGALLLLSACGLKLDMGPAGGSMAETDQSTAQNQPSSSSSGGPSVPPEASLNPGRLRGFALRGSAEYTLEDSRFLQCGYREQWSVQFEGSAFERLQEQALSEECDISRCLFAIEGTGDLSARGRFGQLRTYPREITITSLTRLELVTRAADLAAVNDISCPR
jgi:hypothetical protein